MSTKDILRKCSIAAMSTMLFIGTSCSENFLDNKPDNVDTMEEVFAHLPVMCVNEAGMKALLNGNQLKKSELETAEGKRGDVAADQEASEGKPEETAAVLETAGAEPAGSAEQKAAETDQAGLQVRIHGLDDRFYGVYEYKEEKGLYCPVKMFFPE